MMRTLCSRRIWIAIVLAASFAGNAYAQSEQADELPANELPADEAAQAALLNQDAANQNTPRAKPPGEEVMRPTEHGVRLTPNLARFIGRSWVHELFEKDFKIPLTEEEASRLGDATAQRMMRLGHTHGENVGSAIEYLLESMSLGNGRVSPEDAQEFASRTKKALPAVRELIGSVPEEFRSILNDDQIKKLESTLEEVKGAMDRFEAEMDRWAKEGLTERGNPFASFEEDHNKPEKEGEPAKHKRSQAMRMAQYQAHRNIQIQGPEGWKQFLQQVRVFMNYDDKQYAMGLALLKQYSEKADAIMTPDWRGKVRRNRIKVHFRTVMKKKPLGPWVYHMAREYDELFKPILELAREFRRDVMALATDEQRAQALTELQAFGARHGLAAEEMTAQTLHLAGDEP